MKESKGFFFEPFCAARFRLRGCAAQSSGRENQKTFAPLSRLCGDDKANAHAGGLIKSFWFFFFRKRTASL